MNKYKTGILFVHGIQGSPKQFDFIIGHLPDDVYVRNILLPGHGSTVAEFMKVKSADWQKTVNCECSSMLEKCGRIIYVGHSMGCLLGLAAQSGERLFASMLLICCPFRIRPTLRYFTNSFRASLKPKASDDVFVQAAREANSVKAKSPLSYLLCVKPYVELFKLIHSTDKLNLSTPPDTVFYFSELDEIVGKRSVNYANEKTTAQIEILHGCGHNYFTCEAKEQIAAQLMSMIQSEQ